MQRFLEGLVTCDFTSQTVQEAGHEFQPVRLIISIREQSVIPLTLSDKIKGILSLSTGYDHLNVYLKSLQRPLLCSYLEEYATSAVAEQAIMLAMTLLRKLSQQIKMFSSFARGCLTGEKCLGKNFSVSDESAVKLTLSPGASV